MYMAIAMRQWEDAAFAGYFNVGPDDKDCVTTGELVNLFCEGLGRERFLGGPLRRRPPRGQPSSSWTAPR